MSAVYGASPIKRARRTQDDVNRLDHALYEIVKADPPMTVRQAFYQATVHGLVPKDESQGYRVVQRRLVLLRGAGIMPYWWITDSSRTVYGSTRYDGLEDLHRESARLYRRNYWSNSPVRVEVWIEKDALSGVLTPVVDDLWGLQLHVTKGFASVSYLEAAAAHARHDGRPVEVYCLTDLDPSGIGINERVEKELKDRAPDVDINVHRLAVTLEQVRELNLPTRPTKKTDSRAKKFAAEYGTGSVELDAIPPRVLREMVSEAIEQHADTEEFRRLKQLEKLERETLLNGGGFFGDAA